MNPKRTNTPARRQTWAIAMVSMGALAPASGAWAQVTLDHISAQFVYSVTGALSQDIAPPATFSTWNTVIGEGDAKEPATDLLVSVDLTSAQNEVSVPTPLVVTAHKADGSLIATRTFRNIVVDRGKSVRFLFLPDVACAGQVRIDASFGRQTRSSTLHLDCGE